MDRSRLAGAQRYWTTVGIVFVVHFAITLLMTRARTGFFVFTVPVFLPVPSAASVVGWALMILLVDTGAVAVAYSVAALARLPEQSRPEPADTEGQPGPAVPPRTGASALQPGAVGHLLGAALVIAAGAALGAARDSVFVVGIVRPTVTGDYGVAVRQIFSPSFDLWVPWCSPEPRRGSVAISCSPRRLRHERVWRAAPPPSSSAPPSFWRCPRFRC